MPRLRGNFASINQFQRWQRMFALPGAAGTGMTGGAPAIAERLQDIEDFGENPGNLRMLSYLPPRLPPGAPLVVALHGCTQTAAEYDRGTGWSALAERHGFAVLLPEQRRANNANTCFNWFAPDDIARDHGEAASIRAMIAHMVASHRLDPRRVFITGLSAGGAMTAVMLATYPETFAAGAIIAGLPYGCATNVHEALDCMFKGRPRPPGQLAERVRAASAHHGRWPSLSIWHGTADTTVHPANATELARQWTNLHGLPDAPDVADTVAGVPHQAWRDASGHKAVETYTVPGMGHGVPVRPDQPDGGIAGPYMLDAGIASTPLIAASWGLIPAVATPPVASRPARRVLMPTMSAALRKAGLLR